MPTGLEKQTAQRATDCGETPLYVSKVTAPRNPKLLRGPVEEQKLTPSLFMKEMAQSTHEKLANTHDMRIPQVIELLDMGDTTHQKFSVVDIDEPMFQPFPSEIVFQQFEPHEVFEVPLLLRNNDKVSRLVKVSQADSPYFKIVSPPDIGNKVAPGMAIVFRIQFMPAEKKDYVHELICMTEREKFVVPVKAIGARALLDFPDQVNFSTCPVKYSSTKTLLVRNVGNREARFSLYVSEPFLVHPDCGVLAVNESLQVEVTFKPNTVGDHNEDLVVSYDTAEDVFVTLYGAAVDANVRLDKNTVRIENTFITMANQRSLTINNRSDVIAHFQWKPFATAEEENQQKDRFCTSLADEEQAENDRFLEECMVDNTLRDKMAILTRTFHNRRKMVEGDSMLYSDSAFSIEPLEGDIWPNSNAEINVIFKPEEARTYWSTAYCDITGRETRLPLRMRGDGVGPKVVFSFDTLDMGHIFIRSTHTYEVILSNQGDIDATFNLLPNHSTFGPLFQFSPSEGIVVPGGHQAIKISFSSPMLGDFDEEFFCSVKGLPEMLKLNFKGNVIGPTFHFDQPKLKFGTVSYGFKSTRVVTLANTALVPMTYNVRVPGDGGGEVVSATSGEATLHRTNLSVPPKEFYITPESGTIPSQSEVKVQVELTSNTVKKYDMSLVVDVEGVGTELLALPITAKCVVPAIVVVTPIMDYTRCFLSHPYELNTRLFNDSDLPAKYDLVPQEVEDFSPMLYTSPEATGIIQPHSTAEIPLVIMPKALEEIESLAEFSIFGSNEPPLQVQLMAIGEGPVVHVTPTELDWGQTPVLTDVIKIVTLSNESLIPAPFCCTLMRPNSLWRVEPVEAEIPPEENLEVKLTVHLDDCIRFQDKLAINFENSQTRTIKLQAYGHGTTIVSFPPITPSIELGHHFSSGPCRRMFTLTNRGRRHQQLFWSTEGFNPIKLKNKDPYYNPLDVKYQRMPPPPPPPKPVFSITPSRFELEPAESIDVVVEGQSDTPKTVKERMLCHAIIGKASGKEKVMKTDISIEFISPLLDFSTKQVMFRVDKRPDDVLVNQLEKLTLTNVSSLPLHTRVDLEDPFVILTKDEDEDKEVSFMDIPLEVGESCTLIIQFDPAYLDDSYSRVAEKVLTFRYQEHPHIDYVGLRGEVYFPNLTFEKMDVDFGCILNDTEVTRYVNITNNSPMPVKYRWSFLEPSNPIVIYPQPLPEALMGGDGSGGEGDQHVAFEEPCEETETDGAEKGMESEEQEKEKPVETLLEDIPTTVNIKLPEESVKDTTSVKMIPEDTKDSIIHEEKHEEKSKKSPRKTPRKTTGKSQGKSSRSGKTSVSEDSKKRKEDKAERGDVETPGEQILSIVDMSSVVADDHLADDRQSMGSRTSLRPASARRRRQAKLAYFQAITEPTVVGIEEVFDILPLYGILMPGESDITTFTFYGHTDIGSEAKALCNVEGGPCYELSLRGEASIVQYDFDTKHIDYGKRMFDQVAEAEIVLHNTGKVGFDFQAINMDPSTGRRPVPGLPVMIPHAGRIEALQELKLLVKFLPGVPEKFHKSFDIQVAHFEPDTINLCGEGVFPRISLDLPRYGDEEGLYTSLLKEAKETLGRDTRKGGKSLFGGTTTGSPMPSLTPRDPSHEDAKSILSMQNEFPSELELQMEVERLVVKEFALEMQQSNSSSNHESNMNNGPSRPTYSKTPRTSRAKKSTKIKARLTDYLLDFGYVVLGTVRTHIVRATNTGYFAASFSVDRASLAGSGFNVELDRVRQLPGYPEHETVDFRVSFDPRGANLGLGGIQAIVPINIVNGPCASLRLRASVTMPDMQISTDSMDFGPVQCGQCKVITIQLHNNQHVKCEWTSLPTDKERKLIDKHMPMHLRRKLRPEKARPRNFEMMPPVGMLLPGQRVNVQVKFMPTEEKVYADRITIRLSQSSQRLTLMAHGTGLEPRIEFSQSLLEFDPILPHSFGDEVDVVVKNPCSFPLEFYSLEFDDQYLEEEKVLRSVKGYDEHGTILLPPRVPGEKLASELLEHYDELKKAAEEEEKAKAEAAAAAAEAATGQDAAEGAEGAIGVDVTAPGSSSEDVQTHKGSSIPMVKGPPSSPTASQEGDKKGEKPATEGAEESNKLQLPKNEDELQDKKDAASSVGVGELLEITPVSAAIARHLGIDLTPEGKASMRRRGVSIVVHGAPMSGKTSTAITLAKYYEAALLTVDSVVLESISNGNTPAGLRARELCAQASKAQLMREGEGSEVAGGAVAGAGGLSVEAVAAHAMGLGAGSGSVSMAGGGAHSVISNRKTSTISGHKPAHSTVGGEAAPGPPDKPDKKDKKEKKQDGDNATQLSGSPPPAAPIARRLSVSASVAGEEGLMSCLLPEDLLVEILAERLQLNDCHRGVVFDSLETIFSPNHTATANALLKAFNNRKYIYFVTMKLEQSVFQAREKRLLEEKEREDKEREEDEKRRLEEMSEDEYDELTEEEKADVDRKRLKAKKERLLKKEMEERLERERKERELAALLEEKKVEDDKKGKKKGAKGQEKDGKGAPLKKSQEGAKAGPTASQATMKKPPSEQGRHDQPLLPSEHGLKAGASSVMERPESHGTAGSESQEEGGKKRKREKGRPISNEVALEPEPEKDPAREAELLLTARFKAFDHGLKEIEKILDRWDRTIGQVVIDPLADEMEAEELPAHPPSGRKGKSKAEKEKEKEREKERERLEKERLEKEKAEKAAAESGEEGEDEKDGSKKEETGVPHILMDASEPDTQMGDKVLTLGRLPTAAEVLDGLGLGPNGPPIPPSAAFSVVPYPVKRKAPLGSDPSGHYIFVASSPDDPNVIPEEKAKEVEVEPDSSTPDKGREKDDHTTPTGKGKGKDKSRTGAESVNSRRRSAKGSRNRKGSLVVTSPPPGTTTPGSDFDGQSSTAGDMSAMQEPKNPKLGIFRWSIPAESEILLRLRFQSDELGQFDQTLNFEIIGTRRRYQLYCRGVCSFPNVSREPRIVFPHRKKSKRADEIVHKKYILSSETLQMGPLLAGKSRDRYKECKYPENMEKLTINNSSPLDAEVTFCFQHDGNATTFLMDPPAMSLKPGESHELTLWAYPKNQGFFEDSIVCCVKENPEPILFKISCYGVRPELELDKKQLHFEKVLLHRKDTKTIYLRNSTLLPVAWRTSGLENLGDDFSVTTDTGVIDPKSEFALNAHFRAMRPTNLKKMIRLEVSDVENIMGLLQTENIQVLAEAYDVALDMSFPKGADGGLDFGTIRVMDETKQTCSLKNKGRYEIAFSFNFETTEVSGPEIINLFSVIPQKGVLVPNDRPTQVQVIFKSRKEVTIRDQPILKCQVIEPNISDSGETIASIPVKLSVRSIFSKYNVYPISDINFGAVLVGQRRTRSFIIENKGEFDFKYTVNRMSRDSQPMQPLLRGRVGSRASKASFQFLRPGGNKRSKSRDGSSSGRSVAKPKRADSMRQDIGGGGGGGGGGSTTRLQLGMFTVYPAYGVVYPNNPQVIQVECLPEMTGRGDEDLAIEITDRDPADHPQGIPYKILAEACSPGINLVDLASIFEEHRVVKNLSVFLNSHQLELDGGGVYGEDENKFIFGHVLVGRKVKARFKISNANKVSCDVLFACKLVTSKPSSKLQDIFEVEPSRASIPAHSHVYAMVTFGPPSMQTYTGQFEVILDGVSGAVAKQKNLSFEVQGEGNLPRVSIQKPSIRNKKGSPLLLFKRLLLGSTQTLQLCLRNDGTLPSKVDIDLTDPNGVFSLQSSPETKLIYPMQGNIQTYLDNEGEELIRHPHTASIIVGVGEESTFQAVFKPDVAHRFEGSIRVTVMDNQYEDRVIQMVGEGYQDEITLDNIHSIPAEENVEALLENDNQVSAVASNHIHFGHCHIGESYQLTFTMTNHNATDTVRFQWPEHPQLKFCPSVGHLHGGLAKDIAVTFKTDSAVGLQDTVINCKVCKITFDKPVDQVPDWDDRLRTVKWVDIPVAALRPPTSGDTPGNRPKSNQDAKKEEKETKKEHRKGGAKDKEAAKEAAMEQMDKEKTEEELRRKIAAGEIVIEVPKPAKKKVVETELEPTNTPLEDTTRDVELRVSANADYAKYKCKTDVIHFKDTLMFQTRQFVFQLTNKGTVQLSYNWQVVMEDEILRRKSVSFADEDQMRLPSRCSTAATDLMDVYPFTVIPEMGTVGVGKKQNFTVKFAPLDMQDYEGRLICRVPNLEEGKQGPVISLRGRSLMPYCHFELEDSDYVTGSRRNPELRGPGGSPPGATLDPNTRVIEFTSVGIQVKNRRSFYIINPTNSQYSFVWNCEDEEDPKIVKQFSCATTKGFVAPGKKTEISFDFTPSQLGIVESFWRFTIPEQNILVPFLLVGDAKEPAVATDRSHINFKSLLLGNQANERIQLINNESRPFTFDISEASCHSEAFSSELSVTPKEGIIPPFGRIPIDVSFTPHEEKVVNFNVEINIKKKTLPIYLNVKAEGYSMNAKVLCEDSTGKNVELSSCGVNEINFGEVEVNEKAVRSIFIVNAGKFNFDYEWSMKERSGKAMKMVSISPETGSVPCSDRKRCVLAFKPPHKTSIRGCEFLLKVTNGPSYQITLAGQGVAPGLHFSFTKFDFGPCFIHRAGMPTLSNLLTVTNRDSKAISIDCLYTSTSHLEVQFSACVLQPGDSRDVHLTFYPREAIKYREMVIFELNGLSRTQVEILGEGTEMRVEVANPKDRLVNFGALRVGESIKRTVPVINNSPAPLSFTVVITPLSSILQQLPNVLSLAPTKEIYLKPKGGTCNLDLVFTPKCRIPQFTEEVMLECAGLSQPLFVVAGSCQGIDISLDQESIPFGAVVQRSSTTRKLLMYNTGDIGAGFKWNSDKFGPDFSISPTEGYISPGMTVPLEVTFFPKELSQDIRYDKLRCHIEGGRPLRLVLTGMCVGSQPQKEVLHFNTHVRVKDTRSLTLHNRTNLRWELRPVIEGEHWAGADTIVLEPQQSKPYEMTYRPLIMTAESKKHTGTVFFALPDGSGLLYNLTGVSEAPKAAGSITREVPSKTQYTEQLSVSNWLKRPQRFKVLIEMIKPDKLDTATTLKGLDYIDVPGLSKREYKLNFFCHKEASYSAKVIFRNEVTGEFQFYYATFKSTAPGVIDTIEMTTPVRLSTSHTISLDNPLNLPVTFTTNCPVADIMLPPQLVVPPQSEGSLSFEFLPLKTGVTNSKLQLSSAELGMFQYDLQLTATAAGPEKAVYFRAPLGGGQQQSAHFVNFAKLKTEYTCKVDNSDFHTDKTITAAPGSSGGSEVGIDITFEPSRLGETRGNLVINSSMGGEYIFPLFGTCIPPKPQGPYNIKANSTTSIPFRNVFPHTTAFTFQVDNPAFSCKPGESIRGKKQHNIIVGYEGNPDPSKAPKMGKLVVTCPRSAGGNANVAWTFYLKGITP
ncbi:hydrocephalus-inducing protein homolog [Asterias rubens]|uniref:hydrocephalus-inducing protein homolog n=1 Tax=Asterias rubens TaxID=7604 RepID=UPI001455BA70|nr:hydrocephalus-inducing protein homolog [Asterias rubens]